MLLEVPILIFIEISPVTLKRQCFMARRKIKHLEIVSVTDSSLLLLWYTLILTHPKVLLFDPKDSSLKYGVKRVMTHTRKVKK